MIVVVYISLETSNDNVEDFFKVYLLTYILEVTNIIKAIRKREYDTNLAILSNDFNLALTKKGKPSFHLMHGRDFRATTINWFHWVFSSPTWLYYYQLTELYSTYFFFILNKQYLSYLILKRSPYIFIFNDHLT